MVIHEVTFYLAAVVLLVLTVESCIKLLNQNSFSITLLVYVTVFAWYFVDPFINPEQYDYLPSFLLGQSYGQVLLFLIGFRVFMPVAVRWIVRSRNTGIFATQRVSPEQVLIAVGAIWFLLFAIGIYRMDGDVVGAVLPIDSRAGATMWGREAVSSSASGFLIASGAYLFNAITAFPRGGDVRHYAALFLFRRSAQSLSCGDSTFHHHISVLWASSAHYKTGHSGGCVRLSGSRVQVR